MSEFDIDFEWEVADRYELRPATTKAVSKEDRERQSVRQRERQEGLRLLFGTEEFERIKRRSAAEHAAKDPRENWLCGIPESELPLYLGKVAVAGKLKKYRIKSETLEKAVKLLVAGLDQGRKTPFYTIALKVSQAIGGQFWDKGDSVQTWHSIAQRLRFLFEGRVWSAFPETKALRWPAPGTQEVGELGILLVPDKNNKPVLALRPDSLHSALVFTAARMKANGTTFNICENCKAPFLSGGTRFRNKRGDARFCSNDCRWKWHNEARRRARHN
jgi:hypothetical protein